MKSDSSSPMPPGVSRFDGARHLAGSARPGVSIVLPDVDEAPADDVIALPPLVDLGDPDVLAQCAELEHNDTDNGRRLLMHFGPEILHIREIGWHVWTGKVWTREGGDEAVTSYAQRTARRIHGEAGLVLPTDLERLAIEDAKALVLADPNKLTQAERDVLEAGEEAAEAVKGRRRSIHQHAKNSGNGGKVKAMVEQALPHRSAGPSDLDADQFLFNCQNATLRFTRIVDPESEGNQYETHKLQLKAHQHDRRHKITKMAPVSYDPKATCPRFDAFMERFQPDEDQRRYIQIYLGLSLTGQASQQCFQYWFGHGANGKSTCVEAIAGLFGPYSDLLNAESITGSGQRRGDQATPDFAELPGVRFLRVSELPRGEPLREALIKALTGGEEIKARHLNKGFFKYAPVFKAVMSGNDLPSIGGLDHGIWRRVKLVKWSVTISDDERRPMDEVLAEFAAERSGILNWLIEGLDLFMREGLRTPAAVAAATAEYRDEMDPIGSFVAQCVTVQPGNDETARDMYRAFESFCLANSIRPWKETMFGRAMPLKGFERENGRIRKYRNVKLHDVPERPHAEPRGPRTPIGGDDGHDAS